jgi:hypothetical protein
MPLDLDIREVLRELYFDGDPVSDDALRAFAAQRGEVNRVTRPSTSRPTPSFGRRTPASVFVSPQAPAPNGRSLSLRSRTYAADAVDSGTQVSPGRLAAALLLPMLGARLSASAPSESVTVAVAGQAAVQARALYGRARLPIRGPSLSKVGTALPDSLLSDAAP